jgi:hypothetical protein
MVEEVRPSRPTEENVRTLVTDDLWSMVELCWAHEAAIRPTIASVVTRLIVIKLGADAKRKRDIDVASTYDLSEHLMQRLEALVHDSDDIQVALDILDRVRLQLRVYTIDITHGASGSACLGYLSSHVWTQRAATTAVEQNVRASAIIPHPDQNQGYPAGVRSAQLRYVKF